MKLTDKQKEALILLNEEKDISVGSPKVNERTMYALYTRKLIKCPRYANGEFWEITDTGIEILKTL